MRWTQPSVWACGLVALGVACGGVTQTARSVAPVGARPSPPVIVVTTPRAKDVVVTQQYTGKVRARRHIEVRPLVTGYLAVVPVREGQAVKKGDVLFQVSPILYRAKLEAERAEVQLAELELNNTKKLFDQKTVSRQEVALHEAKLARAQARSKLAEAELDFTAVKAPFDGFIDRLREQVGSLVKEGDSVLTTLSDTSVVWVYFDVSEARYLEFMAAAGKGKDPTRLELVDARVELRIADGSTFAQAAGNTLTVEATFNDKTGTLPFRADFPNPDRLLRHGQTATVLVHRTVKNALVIPQRATFQLNGRQCVFVVGKDDVARLREVVIGHETDGVFVVKSGLEVTDRIVLGGATSVRDGDKLEYEFLRPEDVPTEPKKPAGK